MPPNARSMASPESLPGGIPPELPQVRRRVTAVGEVTAGGHPGEDRDQGYLVHAGKIRSMAERLEAAR